MEKTLEQIFEIGHVRYYMGSGWQDYDQGVLLIKKIDDYDFFILRTQHSGDNLIDVGSYNAYNRYFNAKAGCGFYLNLPDYVIKMIQAKNETNS